MQCVTVYGVDDYSLEKREIPKPGPAEALVRVEVTGVCRTDLKLIQVGHRDLVLPRIPGEEVVGKVVQCDPRSESDLIGKRVYIYPGQACGECKYCLSNAQNLCISMRIMGFHRDGGFAEYVVAPVESLLVVPDALDSELAVLAEPLSCCLNALKLAQLKADERVGIWGAGPAGRLLAKAAYALGATTVNIDPDPKRRRTVDGQMQPEGLFDVCVVAVGEQRAYQQALNHLAPRGRLVVFSGLSSQTTRQSVDFNQLHYFEQTIVGAYGCTMQESRQALSMLASNQVDGTELITHRLPLVEVSRSLEIVKNREGLKVLLFP